MSVNILRCPARELCKTTFGTRSCARTLSSINIPPTVDLEVSIITRQAANVASSLVGLSEPFIVQPQANLEDIPIARLQRYAKVLGF